MAFTVQDFHDLVRLLGEHPDWREELRRLVLTDDLLRLPRVVQELAEQTRLLAEAQRRTEARLEALTQRVEALAQAQQQTEARLEALAQAQKQTEQRLGDFMEFTDRRFQAIMRDLGALKGIELERFYRERAAEYFGTILQGVRVLGNHELDRLLEAAIAREAINWEERRDILRTDLVARGRLRSTGEQAYLLVEVSWGVGPRDVERAHRRAGSLQKAVGRALAAVAGTSILPEARQLAETLGVIAVSDGVPEGFQAEG